jgi:hypothetical protein
MQKPVLMLHEMKDEFLTLPLENYVLTFDDGLYSQYVYYQKIKHIPTPKIFFISSGIVCNGEQSSEFPCCRTAHKKAFDGIYEDYMTVEQIKELMLDPLVTIGCHSHTHTRLDTFTRLSDKVQYIIQDTAQSIKWFETVLGFRPTDFCFPYNEDMDGIYAGLIAKQGFTKFYGNERIPVETLLHSEVQPGSHDVLLK